MPSVAIAHIESLDGYKARAAKTILRLFHDWLAAKGVSLPELRLDHVESFLAKPRDRRIADRTRTVYRHHVRVYLGVLVEHHLCEIDLPVPDLRRTRPILPSHAEQFLAQLEPTTRPNTRLGHRHRLQCFHRWLDEAEISTGQVARHDIVCWIQYLYDQGLAPVTRLGILVTVRMYLWHLADEGVLREPPDRLIRRSDMPKLPKYLPRPLPPDVDQELRRRLEASSSPLHWALLLMRNTGLRIGELRSLSLDCLRSNERGRQFLKVPLGKLHNERLVPVDDGTIKVIDRLKATGGGPRTWLLEPESERQVSYNRLRSALLTACEGLETQEPITSHRLRHSFATTLLNAGMSLTSLMHLLGHRDIRMTLRYAAVTLETVGNEYFAALDVLEQRYRSGIHRPAEIMHVDPAKALDDIARLLKRRASDLGTEDQRRARLLVRRLARMSKEIVGLVSDMPTLPAP